MTLSSQITDLLNATGWHTASVEPLAGDASARRYLRLTRPDGIRAILMDASSQAAGSTQQFEAVAVALTRAQFSAPEIYAADHRNALLLLEDFGDDLLAQQIKTGALPETQTYENLCDLLSDLWSSQTFPPLPRLGPVEMIAQASLFKDWFVKLHPDGDTDTATHLMEDIARFLTDHLTGDLGISHRDFHVENIIWLPERTGHRRFGLLDFQDAVLAPRTYDLASLLTDARRDISVATRDQVLQKFFKMKTQNLNYVQTEYALCVLMRNLRILGIFARLCARDGKPRYAAMMPRVWTHVSEALSDPQLNHFADRFQQACPFPDPDVVDSFATGCPTA